MKSKDQILLEEAYNQISQQSKESTNNQPFDWQSWKEEN